MNKKQISNKQIKTTNIVYKLRKIAQNDCELIEWIGISKGTFYTRLRENNWKKPEMSIINNIYDHSKNR